jgi:hypothetical protein
VVNFSIQYLRVVQGGIECSETPEVFVAGVIHLAVWIIMWIMVQHPAEPNGVSSSSEMLE